MCLGCGRLWTSLQILWSTFYVICGSVQLMTGIFFLISVHELRLYSVLAAGACNIIIGIAGGMVACIGALSPRRQEALLYLAVILLTLNTVHVVLMEWTLYMVIDMPKIYLKYPNHLLIDIACFTTRIANATVLLVAFVDSQLTFCSMQTVRRQPSIDKKKFIRGSHEQVSDIEYIIPRAKPSKQQQQTHYNAYAQSWVFDSDNTPGSSHTTSDSPYLKILQNGTAPTYDTKNNKPNTSFHNGIIKESSSLLVDKPVVHVEEASDDSTSNSDRKLCHMKSFSRSASPVVLSASSSQVSLNNYNPPIYEYLEKLTEPQIYRSRLNTAVSSKGDGEEVHYQTPQAVAMRRVESVSPHAEKVQYASLMKELQRAIISKKEPSSVTSPSDSATASEKTNSKSSSRSEAKSSDAEFSKELEAALQLIQDLESPNTAETPSDVKSPLDGKDRPLAVWKSSDDASESEKTLSAVGSLVEIASPLRECQQELTTFKPSPSIGKGASVAVVHYLDSQSTSGYSSPTHHHSNEQTPPNWSTTSSINGSNNDIMSYSIHNAKSTTVISLYSHPSQQNKGKSVTLVQISGDIGPITNPQPPDEIYNSTIAADRICKNVVNSKHSFEQFSPVKELPEVQHQGIWNVKSLLRKKKTNVVPKLCPELEGAIIKSESLAYLTELELLARHQRNKEIQREIEERVIQQLGVPRTESNC